MAKIRSRDFLVWTDDEVELLLKVTQEYKEDRAAVNVDWESLQTKYGDIFERYQENYPSLEEAKAMGKEYPHSRNEITKVQLATKIKAIRIRYRQAINSGRRNGHGRVILLFFELCRSIWGGTLATRAISQDIKTDDDMAVETVKSIGSSPDAGLLSMLGRDGVAEDAITAEIMGSQHQRLDATPSGFRRKKLKRKLSTDSIAEDDLDIQRRLLRRLEANHEEFMQKMDRWSSMMDRMNSNIELLVQHIVGSGATDKTPRYIWDAKNGEVSLVHECRCGN
ncbi:hypothetical protein EPR50_G00226550 [Perca flavescens]|uniref:Uncharacterized protein n=1 Tax=Perca flavescens TaxID=8167 RepID=A0A484C1S1_PERFV|nr:uncharacterized protein LOC114549014 [Perca flavescens]TDG97485.1 hypothetical protein EPR50_G00226550 [Perca flavescens]